MRSLLKPVSYVSAMAGFALLGQAPTFAQTEEFKIQVSVPNQVHQLASGDISNCAITDSGVKCWGSNADGQLDVPPLKNPKQIMIASTHACAVANDQLTCWGKNAPWSRQGVVLAASSTFAACVVYHGGNLHCTQNTLANTELTRVPHIFYKNGAPEIPQSRIRSPNQLALGDLTGMALTDKGLEFWGDQVGTTYADEGLRRISARGYWQCVVTRHGQVTCEDQRAPYTSPREILNIKNARDVAVGINNMCALDDEGLKCWNFDQMKKSSVYALQPSDIQLKNPRMMSLGGDLCLTDDDGLHCYGNDGFYPNGASRKAVQLDDAPVSTHDYLRRVSQAFREKKNLPLAEAFSSISGALDNIYKFDASRKGLIDLWMLHQVQPLLAASCADKSNEKLLCLAPQAALKAGTEEMDQLFGISNPANIPTFPALRYLAIRAIGAGLAATQRFLISDELIQAHKLLSAEVAPSRWGFNVSTEQAQSVVVAFNRHPQVIEALNGIPRAQGAAAMMTALLNVLSK